MGYSLVLLFSRFLVIPPGSVLQPFLLQAYEDKEPDQSEDAHRPPPFFPALSILFLLLD